MVNATGTTSVGNSGTKKYVSDAEVSQYTPPIEPPYVASFGARTMTVGLSENVPTDWRTPHEPPERML